jgi:putative DNA primase/helicase
MAVPFKKGAVLQIDIDPRLLKVPGRPSNNVVSITVAPRGNNQFLAALWRSLDLCHQIGTMDRTSKKFNKIPVKDAGEALQRAIEHSNAGLDSYFACAEYLTSDNRTAANASAAWGFWMDIDCGEKKHKDGKGYLTVEDAEKATKRFYNDTGIPEPTLIVNSGSGLHVYWILDCKVDREQWQSYAKKLKALTKNTGLLADDSRTSDIASVLRIPGTMNYKYDPPRPVELMYASDKFIETQLMLDAIDSAYCSPSKSISALAVVTNTNSEHGPLDLTRLKSALTGLDPDCDEATWKLRRIAPLARAAAEHPDKAAEIKDLAKNWSSGVLAGKPSKEWSAPGNSNGLTGEVAFEQEWQRFSSNEYSGTPATLGTIYHDAAKAGWVYKATSEITTEGKKQLSHDLQKAGPISPESFPHKPRPGSYNIPTTIPNVEHILHNYGVVVRYNVIKKKLIIHVPGSSGTPDNADNVMMSQILSLAVLNGMSTGLIPEFVVAIADQNPVNPVADWITGESWDGEDRLPAFYETLTTSEDYPSKLKQQLIFRWLVSAVAAALKPSGFKGRGVLTLQGAQPIGKTSWINALVPDEILREQTIKLDHHLDAGNKDSILTATSHWIVEIGELDSSFKKDIARLKGFLTSDQDKIRKPYGRTNSEYPRKTVFCATVNDMNFLVDTTGNTRWWTIPVVKINYQHGIDMQQLFAQVAVDFKNGERWWLTQEEESSLEDFNKCHRAISAIQERIMSAIDLDRASDSNVKAMTPTALLMEIGIHQPTNTQCKEAAAVLRELFGDSKRINGQNKWRIPLRAHSFSLNE